MSEHTIKAMHRINFSIEVDGETWEWVGSAMNSQDYPCWINKFILVEANNHNERE